MAPAEPGPTNASPKFDGTTSNQPNFYRPYQGYANTSLRFGANSNYHSAGFGQSALRQGSDRGIAYTWSIAMAPPMTTTRRTFRRHSQADYDVLNNDRTHVLVFNYVYNLPKFIKSAARLQRLAS